MEAGIPASVAMTERIAEVVETGRGQHNGAAQALHYAIGAMIAHDTAHGRRAFDGIDVERLFAAVQMLRDRDDLEVAPFVAAWAAPLEGLGARERFPAFFDSDFRKAITSDAPWKIERLMRKAITAVAGSSNWPETFRLLESQMIVALVGLSTVQPSRIDYLAPLLNLGPLVEVATLNYDRGMEELAIRAALRCDTGISRWSGGAKWAWEEDADIRLLKLHGSIDWEISQGYGVLAEPQVAPYGHREADAPALSSPAVVFGQRGKVRPEGPFLPMLLEFEQMLGRSRALLVVGYSFRDDHINAAIRKWLNLSPEHEVTLVDPSPELGDRRAFLPQLQAALNPRGRPEDEAIPERFHLIEEEAGAGLRRHLGAGPTLAPPNDAGPPGSRP